MPQIPLLWVFLSVLLSVNMLFHDELWEILESELHLSWSQGIRKLVVEENHSLLLSFALLSLVGLILMLLSFLFFNLDKKGVGAPTESFMEGSK